MSETKKLINNGFINFDGNNEQINNNIANVQNEEFIQINNDESPNKYRKILNYFIFINSIFLIFVKLYGIKFIYSLVYPPYVDTLLPILNSQEIINIKNNKENLDIFPYYEVPNNETRQCILYDPFNAFKTRFEKNQIDICRSSKSSHVCYLNNIRYFASPNGLICKMENFDIDPSKWKPDGLSYQLGPINNTNRGCPILENGFFNMKCDEPQITNIENYPYNKLYKVYLNSWNYNYNNIKEEELAPGKIVFFISRNQDSPNLYFGGSAIINAISMIYYFRINPEQIQVVFLESMRLDNDPYYDFYKDMISRGGEPIHIRDLNKKYHISKAVHVPINWDTPCFILFKQIPRCKYQAKAFFYLNEYIDKYMNISNFIEPLTYDNETFYYPKSVVDPNSPKYTKFVTFQWRKAWPRGRKGQERLIGNGPEMIEKLAEVLPKNILIRLVDTASLTIKEQISIMRKTDYYIGVHGAGLFLSVFMPTTSILHEISLRKKTNNLLLMSSLSGHRIFCDIWDARVQDIDGSKYVYFNPNIIANSVLRHMNSTNFFK